MAYTASESECRMTVFKSEKKEDSLWDRTIDYTKPSIDRSYEYKINGTLLYLNKQQYNFLMEEYWNEKKENYIRSRCLVPSLRGEMKLCRNNCSECRCFKNGKNNSLFKYLTEQDEEEYLSKNPQQSIVEELIKEEQINIIIDAIEKALDGQERYIITQFLLGKTDHEIGKCLNKERSSISKKKKKIIEKIKKYIKQ